MMCAHALKPYFYTKHYTKASGEVVEYVYLQFRCIICKYQKSKKI